jgi:hypothetical protein
MANPDAAKFRNPYGKNVSFRRLDNIDFFFILI